MMARSGEHGLGDTRVTTTAAPRSRRPDRVETIIQQWRRERPDLNPEPMALFGALARAYLLSRSHVERLLAEFGLTREMFDVLAALRRSGPPYRLTPTQLSHSLMLTGAGVTNRLDRLEERGLIERIPDRHDRRSVSIQLTREGFELVDRTVPHFVQGERDLLTDFDQEKVRHLTALLEEFAEYLLDREAPRTGGRRGLVAHRSRSRSPRTNGR